TLELKVHAASNTTGRPEPQSCTNSFVPSFAATSDVRMGDFCAAAGCEGTSAAPKTAGSRTVRRFMMLLPCRSFAASVAADGSIIAKEGRACDYATGHRWRDIGRCSTEAVAACLPGLRPWPEEWRAPSSLIREDQEWLSEC